MERQYFLPDGTQINETTNNQFYAGAQQINETFVATVTDTTKFFFASGS